MKQIVVISGKGGTGKTILTASFAVLANNKIMVDCDVDAADLHLLLHPHIRERHEFRSGKTARLDKKICNRCGKCIVLCRFGAISDDLTIDPISCEGCGLCSHVCPSGAITMEENIAGEWFISDTKYGPFIHAKLGIAEENSGKLVAKIRQVSKDMAEKGRFDYVIVDGPPGIGCPVIASLSGVDCALVVTEPTLSGLHDARRVIEVCAYFKVPVKMVINKYDLNIDISKEIEAYSQSANIEVAGKIRFDSSIPKTLVKGITAVEGASEAVIREIKDIWKKISI
ncbi:MAG: ATP-binding protein [Candidatus Omnitrophica bacterium]|nr:ATP-binding protein [Candidatus Omnitrophota bacterium]